MHVPVRLRLALLLSATGCADTPEPPAALPEAQAVRALPDHTHGLAPASREELVRQCVAFGEHAARCSEALIDPILDMKARYFPDLAAAIATPEGRARTRNVGLREFQQDGEGPLQPRELRCKQRLSGMGSDVTRAQAARIERCGAPSDCETWTRCVMPAIEQGVAAETGGPTRS